MLIKNAVVYMKSTNSLILKYLPLLFIVRIVVYMYITLFRNILTLECMLGHQSQMCVKFQISTHYIV